MNTSPVEEGGCDLGKSSRVGIMQGRLSPLRNNRIQSFPWDSWEKEFEILPSLGIRIIEWTIDTEDFFRNPLLTLRGQDSILQLKSRFSIEIPSITCDFFMENPPWKSNKKETFQGIIAILESMPRIGASILVIPLVDNSSLGASNQFEDIRNFFECALDSASQENLKIAFETDLDPQRFYEFIALFDREYFGINYDIGNSAALGLDPVVEFEKFGDRIINVHVKDRELGGKSVPLGRGNADFLTVFSCLEASGYSGNLIMQTARAIDNNHREDLEKYIRQTLEFRKVARQLEIKKWR
jgi:L-ribulose-5-phosphate 3-epimerase